MHKKQLSLNTIDLPPEHPLGSTRDFEEVIGVLERQDSSEKFEVGFASRSSHLRQVIRSVTGDLPPQIAKELGLSAEEVPTFKLFVHQILSDDGAPSESLSGLTCQASSERPDKQQFNTIRRVTSTPDIVRIESLNGESELQVLVWLRRAFHIANPAVTVQPEGPIRRSILGPVENNLPHTIILGTEDIHLNLYCPKTPVLRTPDLLQQHGVLLVDHPPFLFELDGDIRGFLDEHQAYLLTPSELKSEKENYAKKTRQDPSQISDATIQKIAKDKFLEKTYKAAYGILAGLSLRTQSLCNDRAFGACLSTFLITFFLLDDATESTSNIQEATKYKNLALKILNGETTAETLEKDAKHLGFGDEVSRRFYLACKFRESMEDVFLNGKIPRSKEELAYDLQPWNQEMRSQLEEAVAEVAHRNKRGPLSRKELAYGGKRVITIGDRPVAAFVDAYLRLKRWGESGINGSYLEEYTREISNTVWAFNDPVSLNKEVAQELGSESTEIKTDTLISELPEGVKRRLPLNGCLIRSNDLRITIGAAMIGLVDLSGDSLKNAESALSDILENSGPLHTQQVEGLVYRYNLATSSALFELLSGRYTRDGNRANFKAWQASLAVLGFEIRESVA